MVNQWKPGDTVRLKSGGPPMTVVYLDEEFEMVKCNWFEGTTQKSGEFHPDALERTNK